MFLCDSSSSEQYREQHYFWEGYGFLIQIYDADFFDAHNYGSYAENNFTANRRYEWHSSYSIGTYHKLWWANTCCVHYGKNNMVGVFSVSK